LRTGSRSAPIFSGARGASFETNGVAMALEFWRNREVTGERVARFGFA